MLLYQRLKIANKEHSNTFDIHLRNLAMANDRYEELSTTAISGQTIHCCLPLPHPDRQIRILDLDPVHWDSPPNSQALRGRLRVLNAPIDHEYTALSYVWRQDVPGTSERENRLIIHCNDHLHEGRLGSNCWSALWHLCKINRPLTLTIWVDSICIDQQNDEEKQHQMSQMCGIYRSAQSTYFWLGEATKHTNGAMDFLSGNRITMSTGGVGNTFLIFIKIVFYTARYLVYPHSSGLREIFGRPWLKRLWTLQECLLSRKGILVCGEKQVPWADLVCALESIHYFHTHPWSIRFDSSYLPWLNLANLTRWSAENAGDSLGGVSEALNHPYPRLQAHLHCLKWAVRSFLVLSCCAFWSDFQALILGGLIFFIFVYIFPCIPRHANARLFFPRTQHSILEELRNREANDPKDMYNGMVGILGGDASNTGESLYVIYRRLCTSLIYKTRSLDVLLLANTCTDYNYSSWVINWNSTTPQLWGKAIYYMDRRRSMDFPDVWNIETTTTGWRRFLHDPTNGIN